MIWRHVNGTSTTLQRLNAMFTKSLHLPANMNHRRRAMALPATRLNTCLAATFAAALGMAVAGIAPAAAEAGIEVVMNQAKIVKLNSDAATIVIGNPEIVDATVQDSRTIVLTGKGFGVTNLVILDPDGAPVVDQSVFVSRNDEKSLRVYRRSAVQTLSCTPFCEGSYKSAAESASESELAATQ
jgi:Flp pilus assembly secretin CpaC